MISYIKDKLNPQIIINYKYIRREVVLKINNFIDTCRCVTCCAVYVYGVREGVELGTGRDLDWESKRRTNWRQRLGRRWHVAVCNARASPGPTPATINRSLAASAVTHEPIAVHITPSREP